MLFPTNYLQQICLSRDSELVLGEDEHGSPVDKKVWPDRWRTELNPAEETLLL